MKIVVTGASGFIGKQLVPLLRQRGVQLLLVGRDISRLSLLFPDFDCCDYGDMPNRATGFDMVLHLAVRNNDADGSLTEFRATNVDLMLAVLKTARAIGIKRFVNISSIQALDPSNTSPYAVSKREGAAALNGANGIEALTVYLPLVYSAHWPGKLSFLNRLPRLLARPLFTFLAAAKPTLHVSRFAEFILKRAPLDWPDAVIISDGQANNLVYRLMRRIVDLGFAITVLVLFWYGLLCIWALVRFGSPGPGLFAQERVGRNGKRFFCYKFRTMRVGTKQAGTHEVSASAITGIGSFLRKTKLDELPQIWNILRNEVSLIGPRPCLPTQTELIEARRKRGVLALKPGISGLAQINNIDMSEPERLADWDARYLGLQSILLDLRIAVATATGRGRGDNVGAGDPA